jgi:hypothetical protein
MTLWRLAKVVLALALLSTLAYAALTLVTRPLDGSEGSFLFDAARIRQGLPLYVDPNVGAWEYGPVPSRYYVLYTPFWAAVLAAFPASAAAVCARLLSFGAWAGLLACIVASAPRSRRAVTAAGGAFVASLYPLMLFAAAGRSDAVAVAIAGLALLRSARAGRVGALEGALFALAAFFKPNVLAAGLGAIGADVVERRGRSLPALAGAASCVLACAGVLEGASGGVWVEHLVRSSWMPFSARLWAEQMVSRAPFFVLPLAFCVWSAARARAWMLLSALGASVAWTAVSLAKVGSASNYWMEPCVVGLVVLASVPLPPFPSWLRAAAAPLALAQVAWTGVASVRSSVAAIGAASHESAVLSGARVACGAGPGQIVLADEAGLEMMLDGRAVDQPLVFTQLVRRGDFALSTWVADLDRPDVRGLVLQSDWLERAGATDVEPAHDLFPAALRGPLRAKFELATQSDGLWLYRSRQ